MFVSYGSLLKEIQFEIFSFCSEILFLALSYRHMFRHFFFPNIITLSFNNQNGFFFMSFKYIINKYIQHRDKINLQLEHKVSFPRPVCLYYQRSEVQTLLPWMPWLINKIEKQTFVNLFQAYWTVREFAMLYAVRSISLSKNGEPIKT